MIAAAPRGETSVPRLDDTEFNPQVFAATRHQPWNTILANATAADAALRAALEACSEADLTDRVRFPWTAGSPLWYQAFVSGYDHPSEHYEQFYLEADQVERATAVREEAVGTARRLIAETDPYGWMIYKLGCFYARIGQPAQALPALRAGLAREPRLRIWMAEDAAFAELHADPAFQGLLAEAASDSA